MILVPVSQFVIFEVDLNLLIHLMINILAAGAGNEANDTESHGSHRNDTGAYVSHEDERLGETNLQECLAVRFFRRLSDGRDDGRCEVGSG